VGGKGSCAMEPLLGEVEKWLIVQLVREGG
jgi:hypothetical protein